MSHTQLSMHGVAKIPILSIEEALAPPALDSKQEYVSYSQYDNF